MVENHDLLQENRGSSKGIEPSSQAARLACAETSRQIYSVRFDSRISDIYELFDWTEQTQREEKIQNFYFYILMRERKEMEGGRTVHRVDEEPT